MQLVKINIPSFLNNTMKSWPDLSEMLKTVNLHKIVQYTVFMQCHCQLLQLLITTVKT